MILFLDFDGVLHPVGNRVGGETDFSCLPLLEDWLRDHPKVNVVISSSWREEMDLETLLHIFSKDLHQRIIDKCPIVNANPHPPEFWRYEEIMAWIIENAYTGKWLALDDANYEFPPNFEQLIPCDRQIGIDEEILELLSEKLAMIEKGNVE
jgi:hypothetical protein